MREAYKYFCEICDEGFETKEECLEHEKACKELQQFVLNFMQHKK